MIEVRHKANSPWANLKAILYTIRKCTFARRLRITVEFDGQISGAGSTNSSCWLKVAGLKSGIQTDTNNEQLVAFRVRNGLGEVEFCQYKRRKEDIEFLDKYTFNYNRVQRVSFEIKRERWGAMRWPAWPWAEGCGHVTRKDYRYRMKIERVE